MKNILVTGASSGIGLALVNAYAARGAFVYAGVRDLANLPEALNHKNIVPLKFDVTCNDDLFNALSSMKNANGLADLVINNAGINLPSTIEEFSDQDWTRIFDINFHAPVRICRALLPHMRGNKNGIIVMMSSLSSEIGLPLDGPYAASKAALNRAAESLSYELASFGIKIIVAIPGSVQTNLNKQNRNNHGIKDYITLNEQVMQNARANKSGSQPTEIANELIKIIDDPNAPFFCPLGEQARSIFQKIGAMNAKERSELIYNVTGLNR